MENGVDIDVDFLLEKVEILGNEGEGGGVVREQGGEEGKVGREVRGGRRGEDVEEVGFELEYGKR